MALRDSRQISRAQGQSLAVDEDELLRQTLERSRMETSQQHRQQQQQHQHQQGFPPHNPSRATISEEEFQLKLALERSKHETASSMQRNSEEDEEMREAIRMSKEVSTARTTLSIHGNAHKAAKPGQRAWTLSVPETSLFSFNFNSCWTSMWPRGMRRQRKRRRFPSRRSSGCWPLPFASPAVSSRSSPNNHRQL